MTVLAIGSAESVGRILAILLGWMTGATAEPPAPKIDLTKARPVTGLMDTDRHLAELYRMCPADAYAAEASSWPRGFGKAEATPKHCWDQPGQCFGLCRPLRSHEYCFALARAFQENESFIAPRYAQMLFSYGCALGRGSGCTNRAASIRNTGYPRDPFLDAPLAVKQACEFKTFTIACRLDDAWGCAMLGEAYQLGEGTRQDYAAAQRWFVKSCKLNPDFDACAFAKRFPNRALATAPASQRHGFASPRVVAQALHCAPAVQKSVQARARIVAHRSAWVFRTKRRSVAAPRRPIRPSCRH